MPTYRSITISLISQFDILTIPEYAPPTTPTDPFSNAPTLVNPDHSLVSVYIPTYPSSQFWISYSISPPYPPQLLYYFKFYLNGNLVVSWGCGEDDDYRGKTMFGLFKSAHISGLTKEAALQRRVLCFGADTATIHGNSMDSLDHVMEIKVFRSKGRKRIKPDVPSIDRKRSQRQATSGINLVNAGDVPDKNPQRYYKYTLLDPLDAPFATFRYYYRSWDQLEALGVISPYPSDSSSTTSIESSSVRTQENLAANAERQLSPRVSSNALESFVSVSASSENTATNGAPHLAEEPKNASTAEAATATVPAKPSIQEPSKRNNISEATAKSTTDDDAESQSTNNSPGISPLKIPFFLPRPPTPPPSSTPFKLAQLPNSIPPTTKDFNTLASKESFASLIRKRLPDPDPSAFQLTDPNPTAEPPAPTRPILATAGSLGKRSGTGSIGVLMNVVNSAKNRRRRETAADSAAAAASEEERSEGERTDGETGESVSVGSGSEASGGKAKGQPCGGEKGKEEKKEKREKAKEEKRRRRREEEGNGKQPEERRIRERRRNLWEEL